MPEFILNLGSAAPMWDRLDDFTQGYIEAAFFTETGTGDDGDLKGAAFDQLALATLLRAALDCARFQRENAALLSAAIASRFDYDETRAGHDFWYTRNGHGVGYWDRDIDGGDQLTEAAGAYGTVDLYRGDDGKVYIE